MIGALLRARRDGRNPDVFDDEAANRLHIFVPAVMSAGVLFSVATLLRDAFERRGRRGRERRLWLTGHALAGDVLGEPVTPAGAGLRPRSLYAVVGLSGLGTALYLTPGSTFNYLRPGGYVSDIAWLLASSLLVAVGLGLVGTAAAAVYRRWPAPPVWTQRILLATPLTRRPEADDAPWRGPSVALSTSILVAVAGLWLLTVNVAASRFVVERFDRWVATLVGSEPLAAAVRAVGVLGSTELAVALVALVGLATLRCRPFAAAYAGSVVAGLALGNGLKWLVDRPRPVGGPLAGFEESFPSGHTVQATLVAVLMPLAVLVLTRRPALGRLAGLVLAVGVAAVSVHRVVEGTHFATDVAGGLLAGLALGLAARWVVAHERWHLRCRDCPWRRRDDGPAGTGATGSGATDGDAADGSALGPVIPLRPSTARLLRRVGLVWVGVVAVVFAALTVVVGTPSDPEGDTLVSAVEVPLQLGLLAVAGLGGMLALRFVAAGATLIAFAAVGLGLVAAVEYGPAITLGVTGVFAAPAVLLWLTWQHLRRRRSIVALAVVAGLVLGGEAVAAERIYAHFFGPAHPESPLAALPVDRVEWVWSGAGAREATVVARLSDGAGRAALVLHDPAGETLRSAVVDADADGLVRLLATGLSPGTEYGFAVEVDGHADGTRGRGGFTTFPEGPASFTVAVSSCARTGSNGAVFDAIRETDPLLYVIAGDFHYQNLASRDPDSFLRAYDRVLTAPAQAALYRSVPVAYVYDDHDYGPNDADASSPSRLAARAAYRQAVPHAPLPAGADGPVHQAFTVGRVRFVMTDTRSERRGDTTLGAAQREWLLEELRRADRYALVVWVNPDPWVGAARAGADNWAGFAGERRLIADTIAAEGVRNLVMLSGDAHMVAIDDGTNTDYATGGGGGFPLLHAAALDRPGNVKGGPYSEGTFPGAGQFGLLRVDDRGESVAVELSGRTWDGRELARYEFEVAVPAGVTTG